MQKIFLVEDDPFLVDIYSTKFKKLGYEVVSTPGGEEILGKIREEKPDIVVLDIVLPNIDGWEILKRIRGDEELKDLKIVILSNLGQEEEVKKGMELGATKYLIKAHLNPSEVIEEIRKTLQ
jgi:DNA-binding response OmpR family regulator